MQLHRQKQRLQLHSGRVPAVITPLQQQLRVHIAILSVKIATTIFIVSIFFSVIILKMSGLNIYPFFKVTTTKKFSKVPKVEISSTIATMERKKMMIIIDLHPRRHQLPRAPPLSDLTIHDQETVEEGI